MTAYAIAYLRKVDVNEDIVDYLQKIDATLVPYQGRFLVHGGTLTALEGEWDGDVVVLESRASAPRTGGTTLLPTRRSCGCVPTTRSRSP